MRHLFRELDGWFFARGGPRSAAAFRIAFCALFLFMLWDFYPVMPLLFGHRGMFGTMEETLLATSSWKHLLFHHDSPWELTLWFWGATLVTVLALVGLWTRLTVVLTFAMVILFQERDPFMLYGADVVFRCVGVWLLFLDSGSVWSVDRWWAARRGRAARLEIALWPLKAVQVQMALIYLIAALLKLKTAPWQEGTAVYYALHMRDLNPYFFEALLPYRFVFPVMTYATLLVEGLLPFCLFYRPLRLWALAAGVGLHLGIDILFSIRFFSLAMYCGYLSFLDEGHWAWAGQWLARVREGDSLEYWRIRLAARADDGKGVP